MLYFEKELNQLNRIETTKNKLIIYIKYNGIKLKFNSSTNIIRVKKMKIIANFKLRRDCKK